MELGFTSRDPARAAAIANAIARAYRQRLDLAADDRAQGASAWVQERLGTIGTHARVISEAIPPATGAGLRGSLIIAAALVAGALTGAAAALLLALLRPAARTPDQLSAVLGVECLAALPSDRPRRVDILDAPASTYARRLRQLAAALHEFRRDRPMLLGLASPEPGEGASTVATDLAHLLALQGHQVMLIDGNAEHPAITRSAGLANAPGLREALLGAAHENITVISDPRSGLDILPIGCAAPAAAVGSLFHGPAVAELTARLHASYEFVVLDLAPILGSTDLRAAPVPRRPPHGAGRAAEAAPPAPPRAGADRPLARPHRRLRGEPPARRARGRRRRCGRTWTRSPASR